LAADKINLQKVAKTSKAYGNIKFQSADIMLTGDSAVVKKQKPELLPFNFHS
jgi:lipopolysaccharide assembly outer membrane protein LptD (OstA)